jgi:hypothetical protein
MHITLCQYKFGAINGAQSKPMIKIALGANKNIISFQEEIA